MNRLTLLPVHWPVLSYLNFCKGTAFYGYKKNNSLPFGVLPDLHYLCTQYVDKDNEYEGHFIHEHQASGGGQI